MSEFNFWIFTLMVQIIVNLGKIIFIIDMDTISYERFVNKTMPH